jgi:hypothetical protein
MGNAGGDGGDGGSGSSSCVRISCGPPKRYLRRHTIANFATNNEGTKRPN